MRVVVADATPLHSTISSSADGSVTRGDIFGGEAHSQEWLCHSAMSFLSYRSYFVRGAKTTRQLTLNCSLGQVAVPPPQTKLPIPI